MDASRQRSPWRSPVVAVCAALLGVLLLIGLCAPLSGLLLSMKDYRPFHGLLNSAWVGLRNYEALWTTPASRAALINGGILWGMTTAAGLLIGLPLALAIAAPRRRAFTAALGGLMLLPMAVPELSWLLAVRALAPANAYADAELYRWLYLAQTALPAAAFVALCGAAFSCARRGPDGEGRLGAALRGVGAAALILALCALSPSLRAILPGYSPAIYPVADVPGTFAYRIGLQQAEFARASALHVVKAGAQKALALPAAIALAFVARPRRGELAAQEKGGGVGAAFIALAIAAALTAAVLLPIKGGAPDGEQVYQLRKAALLSLVSALGGGLLGFLLAAVTIYALKGLVGWGMAAFGLVLLTMPGNLAAEFLQMRGLGLVNTAAPSMLAAVYKPENLMLTLALAAAASRSRARGRELALAGAIGLIVAATASGDYLAPMIYTSNESLQNLGLLLYKLQQPAGLQSALPVVHRLTLGAGLALGCGAAALGAYGMSD
ncbi:MAG: sugar ABC transporter permease [Clostridiales bacterium]|nr:sugar ABC transporter permease [Clostridiales bacterium]